MVSVVSYRVTLIVNNNTLISLLLSIVLSLIYLINEKSLILKSLGQLLSISLLRGKIVYDLVFCHYSGNMCNRHIQIIVIQLMLRYS